MTSSEFHAREWALLHRVQSFAREYDMLPREGLLLLALSGGRDSMCLLDMLLQLREEGGFRVAACHFDHQLRGAESCADAAFVEEHCARVGVALYAGQGDVRAHASACGVSVEVAARELRYAFFEQSMQRAGAQRLITAHHADDNVETLLLNLVRGSGLQGLTGIPPRREAVVRPMLCLTQEEICAYAEARRVPYREDSSNESNDYLRNRLRHEVTPLLREMNPQLARSVFKTSRLLRADNDYLRARAYALFAQARAVQEDYVIDAALLGGAPDAIATRAIRLMFEHMGERAVAARLDDILALARGDDPSAYIQLGGGLLVQRVYDELLFTHEHAPMPSFAPVALVLEGETPLSSDAWRVTCRQAVCPKRRAVGVNYLKCAVAEQPLLLRSREQGDALTLRMGAGRKTVKKILVDEKVPRMLRALVPVLVRGDEVVALGDFGADVSWHAQPGEPCYELRIWRTAKPPLEHQTEEKIEKE